jgi:hypothetical protein
MEFIENIRRTLDNIDRKTLQLYSLIAAGAVALLMVLFVVQFYRSTQALKRQIVSINKKRQDATTLLERYYLVKKQQEQVDAILSKEKDFKISQAFEKLLQTTGISTNKAQEPETTSQQVLDGYTEWTLYASLTNLNTKKLTELLYAIEQEERIYTKEVEIEQTPGERSINVKITIATLEPKEEIKELAEQ